MREARVYPARLSRCVYRKQSASQPSGPPCPEPASSPAALGSRGPALGSWRQAASRPGLAPGFLGLSSGLNSNFKRSARICLKHLQAKPEIIITGVVEKAMTYSFYVFYCKNESRRFQQPNIFNNLPSNLCFYFTICLLRFTNLDPEFTGNEALGAPLPHVRPRPAQPTPHPPRPQTWVFWERE